MTAILTRIRQLLTRKPNQPTKAEARTLAYIQAELGTLRNQQLAKDHP
jgi:hypothetical protein